MKALILNSGLGHRMGEFTRRNHKSMARLSSGESIFGRQLRLLAAQGIADLVVTTGPHAEQLEAVAAAPEFAGLRFTFVPNELYEQTNYIYSMYLAREHLDDDVLLLHGDLVFNSGVLARLLADPRPDLAAVNHDLPQPEKDFKARLAGEVIGEVSVTAFGGDCAALQPLYKLSRRAMGVWLTRVSEFIAAGNTGVYAEDALNEVSELAGLRAFSYAGNYVNEVDNPDDLAAVSAAIRLFDFAEQPVLTASGDYRKIPGLLASAGASRPLLVGGSGYRSSFLKSFLDEQLSPVVFSGYSANPRIEEVRAGLRLFTEQGCDSVISLGGGSAMDVAKCIKLLAAGAGENLPSFGEPLVRHVPHLAVPTTAGTGSESTHFAVVYVDGEKRSIAHDAALPEWALLEPRLLEGLPEYHKRASLLDALAQCIESLWAGSATEQSREYAERGLRLILETFFAYFHKDVSFKVEAARRMQLAANYSGKAINLTKTTAPHAMSYGLTARCGIAHGHAAALCLSAVWRQFEKLVSDRDPRAGQLGEALDRITRAFGSRSNLGAIHKLDVILEVLQLVPPRLKAPGDLDALVDSVNTERLGNSPVPLSSQDLRVAYEYVFGLRDEPYPADGPADPAADPRTAVSGSVPEAARAVRPDHAGLARLGE
ncbi:MAG: iron-containing alcohol dehydrogenase, partial [Propionibacteriaceae bacterium]|nr:iron-containing alcohol dehydrogenase [Propionibacteriaceae bacterium]